MRNLRLALLGLAAVAALVLGGNFLQRAFKATTTAEVARPEDPTSDPGVTSADLAARQKIEAAIATTPDYVRFFDRLRLAFPTEYGAIVTALGRATAAAGQTPNVDAVMADAVGALRKSSGSLAAKASDDALAQIFVLQLREMQALAQSDAHLCVAFLYGASGTGFLKFAAEHRGLIADAAIAGLDAMSSGRTAGVMRSAPGDGDFQVLDRALTQKGLSRPEIEALLDGRTPDPPIADERMCAAGQTYLATLATIPEGPRSRLYGLAVDLLAKS